MFDVEQYQDLGDFEETESPACSLNSSTISSGELTCMPNAFRLVERTNRKAGIMQRSTIAVRQISRCYNA